MNFKISGITFTQNNVGDFVGEYVFNSKSVKIILQKGFDNDEIQEITKNACKNLLDNFSTKYQQVITQCAKELYVSVYEDDIVTKEQFAERLSKSNIGIVIDDWFLNFDFLDDDNMFDGHIINYQEDLNTHEVSIGLQG